MRQAGENLLSHTKLVHGFELEKQVYHDCMLWKHVDPLKLLNIDDDIKNCNIDRDIKNIPGCHMVATRTHDINYSRIENSEASLCVAVKYIQQVTPVQGL